MSTYPIIYQGHPAGELRSEPDGLYTVFTARCAPVSDALRLFVYGEGGSAYLGLMLPEEGALFLRKRMTRLQLASFPDPIRYAAEAEAQPPARESVWTSAPDGTLRRTLGGREEVAVPVSRVRAPGVSRQLLQVIAGREYLVFPL